MDPTTPETRRADQQTVLHRITDVGADLVAMVHAQAKVQAEAAPTAPLTHAINDYDRATRAIRRNIMLSQKLDQPTQRRAAGRRQIIRAVENHIHRHADDDAELHAELMDRLDRPELAEDLDDDRPVEAIITDIVRDLGLAAIPGLNDPWKRRRPEDIETLHAQAAEPSPAPAPRASAPRRPGIPPATPPPISTA